MKNFDSAEKCAREALKLDPKHTNPYANQLLGMILAAKGDYSGAAGIGRAKAQLAEIERLAENQKPPAPPHQ